LNTSPNLLRHIKYVPFCTRTILPLNPIELTTHFILHTKGNTIWVTNWTNTYSTYVAVRIKLTYSCVVFIFDIEWSKTLTTVRNARFDNFFVIYINLPWVSWHSHTSATQAIRRISIPIDFPCTVRRLLLIIEHGLAGYLFACVFLHIRNLNCHNFLFGHKLSTTRSRNSILFG
jgi:hypothetical protein